MPVLNKVDLPAAEPEKVKQQIEDVIGLDASDAILISAKTGVGIPDVLEAIVHRLPAPKGDRNAPLKALLEEHGWEIDRDLLVAMEGRRFSFRHAAQRPGAGRVRGPAGVLPHDRAARPPGRPAGC